MLDIFKGFNNQDGRFNRFKFWVHSLILSIILIILTSLMTVVGKHFNIEAFSIIGDWATILGSLYIWFTAYIKRLHDLDKSGWMSLLGLIPFANIYLFIICGFFKGTKGTNKYGKDPLESN